MAANSRTVKRKQDLPSNHDELDVHFLRTTAETRLRHVGCFASTLMKSTTYSGRLEGGS